MDKLIEELQKKTGFDKDTVGCFISNYMIPYRCEAANDWCKELYKCHALENMLSGIIYDVLELSPSLSFSETIMKRYFPDFDATACISASQHITLLTQLAVNAVKEGKVTLEELLKG